MTAQTSRTSAPQRHHGRTSPTPTGVTGLPAVSRPGAPSAPPGPGGQDATETPSETLRCAELARRHECHFSADQIWRLVALRRRVRAGWIPQDPAPPVDPRLRFARWLYEQGRISG